MPAIGCQDMLRDLVGVVPEDAVYHGTWTVTQADGSETEQDGYVTIDISSTTPDVSGSLGIDEGHYFDGRLTFLGDLDVTSTTGVFAPETRLSGYLSCTEETYRTSCRMTLRGTNASTGIEYAFFGYSES
jgi:hypothetical protein